MADDTIVIASHFDGHLLPMVSEVLAENLFSIELSSSAPTLDILPVHRHLAKPHVNRAVPSALDRLSSSDLSNRNMRLELRDACQTLHDCLGGAVQRRVTGTPTLYR